jgi:hypothetical protein
MDELDSFFIFQQGEAELEHEAEEDRLEIVAGALAIVVGGAEIAREFRNERRRETRQYLVRGELLPNPRVATPWQVLYESRNDRAYITTMSFDVKTFDYILETFQHTWLSTPIPRTDTNGAGNPWPGARSLDPPGALGLALHYLSSTMHNVSLQQIFALIPSTVSWYINFALDILLACLRQMPDAAIQWPRSGKEFQECNDLILVRHPLLIGAFAAIDRLNVPLQTSQDEDIENATYNGWLSEHFISSVLVFSPKGQYPSPINGVLYHTFSQEK